MIPAHTISAEKYLMFGKNRPRVCSIYYRGGANPYPFHPDWLPARFASLAFLSMRLVRVGKRFRHAVPAMHVRAILLHICCQQSDNSAACHVQDRSLAQTVSGSNANYLQ